ncbi:MAG: hypothetical protein OXU20_13205, partial [Myxococcales bacterium]|nr:hypothetical protein [Myxococcales bacterium]
HRRRLLARQGAPGTPTPPKNQRQEDEVLDYQPTGVRVRNARIPVADNTLDPNGACGANNNAGGVAQVCDGGLVIVVGDCARTIKSQPQNLFSDNETLKPLVAQCVYEDPQFTDTLSMECLGCFLDVALCAGNLCLPQCLSGNTPECDQCRKDNNCEQPLFPCAGLPNPL